MSADAVIGLFVVVTNVSTTAFGTAIKYVV
jgi:hypothetical protein